MDLNFFELFKLYFSLGIDHDPHDPYVHMTYVYSFSHVSFFTRSHGQEKLLSYYDLFITLEYYSMDAPPPSFSCSSSITPPLYLPSKSSKYGLIWRRVCDGPDIWRSGRSWEYGGGLCSAQTTWPIRSDILRYPQEYQQTSMTQVPVEPVRRSARYPLLNHDLCNQSTGVLK